HDRGRACGGEDARRPRTRVPEPAPRTLLRLQRSLPVEEEVQSGVRGSLPRLSAHARAAPGGDRAGARTESRRRVALLPAAGRDAAVNLTLLVLVLALTPFAKGTVERVTMAAPSVGDAHRTVRVYLPADYATSATRRYPVVYLLHGWPGSDGNWFSMGHAPQIADSMIANGEIPSVILVCPNGSGRGLEDRTFFMNSQDGRLRMEDYIAHDVVAWTDSTFRTLTAPRDRAVIGLSDGATAAVNLVFRHTDVFGACGG